MAKNRLHKKKTSPNWDQIWHEALGNYLLCFHFFFPSSISNNSPLAQLAGERIVAIGPLVYLTVGPESNWN